MMGYCPTCGQEANPALVDFCPQCLRDGVSQPLWPVKQAPLPEAGAVVGAVESMLSEAFWRRQLG